MDEYDIIEYCIYFVLIVASVFLNHFGYMSLSEMIITISIGFLIMLFKFILDIIRRV